MAYYGHGLSKDQGIGPSYNHHARFGSGQVQPQKSSVPTNSYVPPNYASLPPNGQYDPRYAIPQPSHQHRPLSNSQINQRPQQRAYTVEVSQPASFPNLINGHNAVQNKPQNAYTSPSSVPASSRVSHSTNLPTQHLQKETLPDCQTLLLSLAEEYFAAAHKHESVMNALGGENDMQQYYKLVATGLGCLEAVLNRFKLLPEREAVVRLRYATVLYEETENMMVAEESLSKGVLLCERHRFIGLKYNMHHLLARMLFDKSPRAAFKFLDGVIKDVEAYEHVAWVYAFRFLQVSLHFKLSTHQDVLSALNQLRYIINMSNDNGDKAVLAIATIIEALTCLRALSDEDNFEHAQRALATVRSLQLDPRIGELHQLTVMSSIIDLCCYLQHFDPSQALAKLQTMQTTLKDMDASESWMSNGLIAIPMNAARMPSCNSHDGIVRKDEKGSLNLMFNWMSKDDVYNLGYLLNGIARGHRNTLDGQKAEDMLEEGMKRMRHTPNNGKGEMIFSRSISQASSEQKWQEDLICYMRLNIAFMLCTRTSWSAAKEQQSLIQAHVQSLTPTLHSKTSPSQRLSGYLEAVICQGTGNLDQALAIYDGDDLSIQGFRKTNHPSQLHRDVTLLSALNTLLIIGTPGHPRNDQFSSILSFIEKLCLQNPNRQIQSAFHLVTATSSSTSITNTKQSLQSSLQTAKPSQNHQLMCMLLNLMSWRFFRGVVGDQAEKSAMATNVSAQKCMNSLWLSVSAGVLSDHYEAVGKIEEAKKIRDSGQMTAATLPEPLQVAMKS